MRQRKYKYLVCASVVVYIYYFFGVSDYLNSKNFDNSFDYPLNLNIKPLVEEIISGTKPSVAPINYYPHRFLSNSGKCAPLQNIHLFIVVKSAMENFGHRNAIRQTYGRDDVMQDRTVKTLFFLGIDGSTKSETQRRIDKEMAEFKDIIQIDFYDNYFNNTIKTMMSFRWVYEHCSKADYYLFTDDDMYISVKNLLKYVGDLKLEVNDETLEHTVDSFNSKESQNISQTQDSDKNIYAGYVFKSSPQRFSSSKWRVSLEEYPWDRWPAYVTAGAYVVSNKAMKTLYAGSLFVKQFRFDDIYLGIVAKKVGMVPVHCPLFHFYKKRYSKEGYRDVIASHGYSNHEELVRVWNEQNKL